MEFTVRKLKSVVLGEERIFGYVKTWFWEEYCSLREGDNAAGDCKNKELHKFYFSSNKSIY